MLARIFKRAKKPQTDASSPETPTQEAQVAKPAPQPDQALIEALSESRRRFKDIVEVSGDFAWETDAGGVFVYVSPGKSLGYQPDEMVGTPASRFLSKAAVDGAVTPFTAREAIRETDPGQMLEAALEEARLNLAADYADIRRPDDVGVFDIDVSAGDAAEAPVLKTVFNRMTESRSMVTAADGDHYHICAPIVYRDDVTGTLLVSRTLTDGAFSEDERRFCEELAGQFALLLAQSDSHRQLEDMARTDEMTGRLNRRAFLADLADRTARAADGGSGGALFYVDLDNFKAVNDVHGHQRGDEALIALSDLLVLKSRPGDLVARLGGDEFAMWLDRTDEKAAVKRAKDLLDASRGLRIFSGSPDKPLGISVGVAVFDGGSKEQVDELTARADRAMYEIKHGGKSGYVVADQYRESTEPDEPFSGEERAQA